MNAVNRTAYIGMNLDVAPLSLKIYRPVDPTQTHKELIHRKSDPSFLKQYIQ